MSARVKIMAWTVGSLVVIGLLVFLLGPVLFASVAYPLPDNFRAPLAIRAQQYGISPNAMAALTFVESGFNMNARSCCAIGPTQFTPSTARTVAKRLGVSPFSPEDLTRNADLAEWFASYYISEGVKNYGSLHLAYVAYNGGGGAANASKNGYGFPAVEGYARKIERIEAAYNAIYGEWWKTGVPAQPNSNPAPAAPAAPAPPPTVTFTVLPKYDVGAVTSGSVLDIWQGLVTNAAGSAAGSSAQNAPAPGDITNLWKALIPST